jgi:GNAT superfamily N-acetyltransferase
MSTQVITKFAVASDRMIDELLYLTRTWMEEHPAIVPDGQYTRKILVDSMNRFSSQWLIVYVGEEPAGFAFLTDGGARPEVLENKRIVQLSAFAVLQAYAATGAGKSLLEKCLAVYKGRDAMWTELTAVQEETPLLETYGFEKLSGSSYWIKASL